MSVGKAKEVDMCSGTLWKNILVFSVPLMCSNVLQVLFNLSDVAVVGRFDSAIALGSVGSTSILISLTTGLLLGMASGINAVTALHMGACHGEKVQKTVHSSFLLCLLLGLCIMAAGLLFARPVLTLLHTKDELIDGAVLYLKIYLCGSPALALYNYGNAVLGAIGDTRRPLICLSISGILNVLLNLFFVICLHMGVAGVALASILSQYLSAILVLRFLVKSREVYRLEPRRICFDPQITLQVLRISIPACIQNTLFAIANLFVQSAVNSFDHVVVEGNSAATNADSIVYDTMAAFYTACTSFIAQNYGAGKTRRILRTYLITTAYSFAMGAILGGLLVVFRIPFLSLFTTDAQVLKYGTVRLVIMGWSYCISAFMDNATAASRGIGKSLAPTAIVIAGSVIFRVAWIYTIFAYFHTLQSLYLLYAFAWSLTALAGNIYFLWHYRKLARAAA